MEALYNDLYTFVEGMMRNAQTGASFSVEEAFALIPRVLDIPRATEVLYRRAIYTRASDEDAGFAAAVVYHSIHVAVYALKIGDGLGYRRNSLIGLGVASLLHDVGMAVLPPDIFSKGRLDEQDVERVRQHPLQAHDILSRLGDDYSWLTEIALQEHEREDGSGYPHELRGNQIHTYAKTIGVANTYAGLTRSRPERRGLLPFDAVKEITQNYRRKFDPRVVRVLLQKLSAFPVGSLIRLNSGVIGQVVETDEAYPLRPAIRVLYDVQGRKAEENRVLQLRDHPILHIMGAIYEEDIREETL